MRQSAGPHHRHALLLRPTLHNLAHEGSNLGTTLEARHRRCKRVDYNRHYRNIPPRCQKGERHYFRVIERQVNRGGEIHSVLQTLADQETAYAPSTATLTFGIFKYS